MSLCTGHLAWISHKIKHGFRTEFCGKSGLQSWCPCNPDVFTSPDHAASWARSFPSCGKAHLVPVCVHPSVVVPVEEEHSTAQVAKDHSETGVKEADASDGLWIQQAFESQKSERMSSGSAETQSSPFPLLQWPDAYGNVALALQWRGSQKKRQRRWRWHCQGRATAMPECSWDRLPAQLSVLFPCTLCSSCNVLGSSKPQICHHLI